MTPATEPQAHEFRPVTDPAFKGTTFAKRCCKAIDGRFCGQPRDDPIHRLVSDTEADGVRMKLKLTDDGIEQTILPSEAQAAPPETIWIDADYRWPSFRHLKETDISYTRTSTTNYYSDYMDALHENDRIRATTSGLAEALRELVNSAIDFDDARISYVSMQVDRSALATAREALAKYEGRQS